MTTRDLKSFSLIWSAIFGIIALLPILRGDSIRYWSLAIALIFLIIAFNKPEILKTFYTIWTKIGESIGGVVSKVVLFILYFALFTPISAILKIVGKELLNKKIDKDAKSYWIKRTKQPESMKNQF